jgi:hypothetical protein
MGKRLRFKRLRVVVLIRRPALRFPLVIIQHFPLYRFRTIELVVVLIFTGSEFGPAPLSNYQCNKKVVSFRNIVL